MTLLVVAALQATLRVAIFVGGADIDHAQGPGLPDGVEASLEAQGGVSQHLTDRRSGKRALR